MVIGLNGRNLGFIVDHVNIPKSEFSVVGLPSNPTMAKKFADPKENDTPDSE